MNTDLVSSRKLMAAAAMLASTALLAPATANAELRSRSYSMSRIAADGASMLRSGTLQAGSGLRSNQRELQFGNGASRSVDRGYDLSAGEAHHSVSSTSPSGQVTTRSGSTRWGDGSYSHSGSATGPNGQTYSNSAQGTYGDGSYSRSFEISGPQGSATSSASGSYDPATGIATYQRSITGPNGGGLQREGSVTYTAAP